MFLPPWGKTNFSMQAPAATREKRRLPLAPKRLNAHNDIIRSCEVFSGQLFFCSTAISFVMTNYIISVQEVFS